LRAATWQLDGGITNGRPSSTAWPLKLCRTSASRRGKEVTDLTKARLISLLLIASLFAYASLGLLGGFGICDGGGLL
jgi:hypothetical protein